MNKYLKYITACVIAFAVGAAAVSAAPRNLDYMPQGFDRVPPLSVAEVMNSARDHQLIVMQGRLTQYLGRDLYEFTDRQGQTIVVDLNKDYDWSHVQRNQLINIIGKVDRGITGTIIRVRSAEPAAE